MQVLDTVCIAPLQAMDNRGFMITPAMRRMRRLRRRLWNQRHIIFALSFFTLNLAPILGFVTMLNWSHSFVSTYLAYLGLAGLICIFASAASVVCDKCKRSGNPWPVLAVVVVVLLMIGQSQRLAKAWVMPETLARFTLEKYPHSWPAINELAVSLSLAGRHAEALPHHRRVADLRPQLPDMLSNLAGALYHTGDYRGAMAAWQQAYRLYPLPRYTENMAWLCERMNGIQAGSCRRHQSPQ
jgi:tetratricopeptide (TPR) repeat protein